MPKKFIKIYLVFLIGAFHFSCTTHKLSSTKTVKNNTQEIFWKELTALCGKAFKGTLLNAAATDTVFNNQSLIMHVRSCDNNVIRVPFMVGSNRSRTWIITRLQNGLELKHDHRHPDGTENAVTLYGGHTANSGSSTLQIFPADQHTVHILPAAAGNVWWVELVPGKYFNYNLRRMGTERLFTIQFDLTKTVDAPTAPWGWKD